VRFFTYTEDIATTIQTMVVITVFMPIISTNKNS